MSAVAVVGGVDFLGSVEVTPGVELLYLPTRYGLVLLFRHAYILLSAPLPFKQVIPVHHKHDVISRNSGPTSENSGKAKFAEFYFHEVRE